MFLIILSDLNSSTDESYNVISDYVYSFHSEFDIFSWSF